MASILLFFLGLLLPLAIVGGVEIVFYVMDLISYQKELRKIKFAKKLADAKAVQEAKSSTQKVVVSVPTRTTETKTEQKVEGQN